jgi:hypothetical protein
MDEIAVENYLINYYISRRSEGAKTGLLSVSTIIAQCVFMCADVGESAKMIK